MSKQKKVLDQPLSLRDKILAYRRDLHGDVAATFDWAFVQAAGTDSKDGLKGAMAHGSDLQKAFVAAKAEAAKVIAEGKKGKVRILVNEETGETFSIETIEGKIASVKITYDPESEKPYWMDLDPTDDRYPGEWLSKLGYKEQV